MTNTGGLPTSWTDRGGYSLQIQKVVEEQCKKGNHMLERIYEAGPDCESTVVRWCLVCGSVTIDIDYDCRTQPGAVMKMKSPAITKALG